MRNGHNMIMLNISGESGVNHKKRRRRKTERKKEDEATKQRQKPRTAKNIILFVSLYHRVPAVLYPKTVNALSYM